LSLLSAHLPGALKVLSSLSGIFIKGKEVTIISKADCDQACLVTELGIKTSSIEEEEDKREQ
jgi:hypothetical protein